MAVAQPGMPGVLTAGFLRFVCKFALVAYLPLLLVDGVAPRSPRPRWC